MAAADDNACNLQRNNIALAAIIKPLRATQSAKPLMILQAAHCYGKATATAINYEAGDGGRGFCLLHKP